jgi:adenylate cyclase
MAFCKRCPGGAEVELTMLFADLRGSTAMAERMSAEDFAGALKQFYESATNVLIQTDAYIDKLVADEVVGLYFPLFAGKAHARRAVEAAGQLLLAAGYVNPSSPLFPAGIGVHKGTAFVGTVAGAEGTVTDIAALGHDVHIAARLSSTAAAGEALISEAACQASGLDLDHLDRRQVTLKGRTEPLAVRVLRVG